MTLIILLVVFIGTAALLVGLYLYVNRRNLAAADAVLDRLREVELNPKASVRSILKVESVSELPLLQRLLAGRGLAQELTVQIQKAGVTTTPGGLVLWSVILAALGYLLGSWMSGNIIGVAAAFGGIFLPWLWLKGKQAARIKKFQEQLPDAIDMLVSAMKAGYSFQAAMKFIGEEVAAPLGPEFTRFYDEQRLGMDVRTALLALQERVDSLDLKMFVTAILIQRETGGNLGEVLANISGLMRERQAIKGEIETLTAESKLSARILSALPVVVFIAVNLLNPGFMKPFLARTFGVVLLVVASIMVVTGYFMMMKIADVDI